MIPVKIRFLNLNIIIDGSITELVAVLNKKITKEEVKKHTENNPSFDYNDDLIVSSDVIDTTFSGIFDPTQTEITAVDDLQLVKTVSWYDNEYGFVSQMIRTLTALLKLI